MGAKGFWSVHRNFFLNFFPPHTFPLLKPGHIYLFQCVVLPRLQCGFLLQCGPLHELQGNIFSAMEHLLLLLRFWCSLCCPSVIFFPSPLPVWCFLTFFTYVFAELLHTPLMGSAVSCNGSVAETLTMP